MAGKPDLSAIAQLDSRAVIHRVRPVGAQARYAGEENPRIFDAGVFVTMLIAFFLAEMGD